MAWFKREKQKIKPVVKKGVPDGLWVKCPTCSEFLYKPELEKSLSVCRHCSHHFRVDPSIYLSLLLDNGSSKELFTKLQSKDLLQFKAGKKYKDQLVAAKKKTGQNDAINCYQGKIEEKDVALGIMNFSFIGGSMGSVVGEKVARLIDFAHENNLPLILICASGGARMQEGAISLMQLAKTSSKLAQFSEGGGLYIPILTDPTTGGVTASYGMLGDIILAEPGALIGFAGPRVIKQTIGQDLPEGFQRTEFLKEKGFVDHIVTRDKMKATLYSIISILK
ncbi:MAG: acetyl-coenzyme A carboxylase carboxyl transferase subunit beta [Candidatus Neomarinimicrobiota bacterium]|jgi:acetyl-CoA carboxylase carboxyl transferase subunit beta|nr:MAG: acetyl-coenzyme A carboxylase carboxyl transferase subunit beta [Candidatus Neomarinimicrobiota bacterium]